MLFDVILNVLFMFRNTNYNTKYKLMCIVVPNVPNVPTRATNLLQFSFFFWGDSMSYFSQKFAKKKSKKFFAAMKKEHDESIFLLFVQYLCNWTEKSLGALSTNDLHTHRKALSIIETNGTGNNGKSEHTEQFCICLKRNTTFYFFHVIA